MHAQQGIQSSHHLWGAVVAWKRLPWVREERVPRANILARLRRGQPEGLHGDSPWVERIVRHPGLDSTGMIAPRRGAWILFWTALIPGGEGFIDIHLTAGGAGLANLSGVIVTFG